MKNTFFLISLLLLTTLVYSQVSADAGPDRHICYLPEGEEEFSFLGGNPTAFGGTAPYTYCWHCAPIPLWEESPYVLHAHDFLDDTTSSNPQVVNIVQPTLFYLTVTDAIGNTAADSVWVSASIFSNMLIEPACFHIARGDSVFVLPSGVDIAISGGGNVSYLWQPSYGLSDSTIVDGFWAKPEVTTTYSCILTDSMGCTATSENCLHIIVETVGIESDINKSAFNIYPNPTNNELNIELPNSDFNGTLNLMDGSGKIIFQKSLQQSHDKISLYDLSNGIYIVQVKDKNGNIHQQKVMKR